VAGFISEWWPTSNRNGGRHQIGIPGRIESEFAPIALLYKEWPGHGFVPPEDVVIVGTIGDLHTWIQRDESDFDFLLRTILFGVLSACAAVFLALPEKNTESDNALPLAARERPATISPHADVEPDGAVDGKDEPTSPP
jgi:hypothetical protein